MGKLIDSVSLECRSGTKDAVYFLQIESVDGGCLVKYQNGRRGGTLASGLKTKEPVDLEKARKVFDGVVKEKLKASPPYKLAEQSGGTFTEVQAAVASRATGLLPQLLNAIDPTDTGTIHDLIRDEGWLCQVKHDGERRFAQIANYGDKPIGANRKGDEVALPSLVAESLAGVVCTLDGELVGDRLFVFDLLEIDGIDLRDEPYIARKRRLNTLASRFSAWITVVDDAVTAAQKERLIAHAKSIGLEGVVFKRLDAPYTPGRPSTGGPQLKLKNWKSATVMVVSSKSDRRSVNVAVLDDVSGSGLWVNVGAVTVPANAGVWPDGTLIDVRYLYAYEHGALFQPNFGRVRTDLDEAAACMSQLEYKQADVDVRIAA